MRSAAPEVQCRLVASLPTCCHNFIYFAAFTASSIRSFDLVAQRPVVQKPITVA